MRDVRQISSRLVGHLAPYIRSWFGWILFAVLAYVVGMYATAGLVFLLARAGVFNDIDPTTYSLVTRLIMYSILMGCLIAIPVWLKQRVSFANAGLGRSMQWKDIGMGVAGFVLYILLAMGALALLKLIPGIDTSQTQDLGVGQVYGAARATVFVVLVIITPLVEEVIFRGLLYGGLRMRGLPVWATALTVSVLFGFAHGQLNVGVDVFCLSIVACYARELTGSIWAGVLMHIIKNMIAFVILFVINQG